MRNIATKMFGPPSARRAVRTLRGTVGMFVLAWSLLSGLSAFAQKPPEEDPEVKLGRENAAQNDKEVKLLTDLAVVERVNRIGQEIAAIANSLEVRATWGDSTVKKFQYVFKVIDEKDVNAYSLPGGFIYIYKGLLDFCESDDELAGVLAHEVAHASHHHMMRLLKEQDKIQRNLLPLLLASLLVNNSSNDLMNAFIGMQLYTIAKLNTYGIEAEKDSDQTAIVYLSKTKYNPVGLLTFMERLARRERLRPQLELGIYRTHPPSPERAEAMIHQLMALNIPIARSEVDASLRATAIPSKVGDVEVADVMMRKVLVMRLTAKDGMTAVQRAQEIAFRLNRLFDAGLLLFDVRLSPSKNRILARGQTVVAFSESDGQIRNISVEQAAREALEALHNLIAKEQLSKVTAASGMGS